MKTPAEIVLEAAGGPGPLAKHLEIDRSWIWRWGQPRIKGGLDGEVPQKHHKTILRLSKAHGWGITPADLIGWDEPAATG